MHLPRKMTLTAAVTLVVLARPFSLAIADPPLNFIEKWPGTSVQGWGGGSAAFNPGTNGVDGAGDGFLLVANAAPGPLGVRSNGAPYVGDWMAAHVNLVKFFVNDVGNAD